MGIEFRCEFGKLPECGVLDYDQGFGRQFEPFQFHCRRDHDRRFACAYTMRKQCVAFDAPADRPFLMTSQDKLFAVDDSDRPGVNIKCRKFIMPGYVGVEDGIVNFFQLFGCFRRVHYITFEFFLQFILELTGGQSRFLIHHQFFLSVPVIFLAMDDRLFEIQRRFDQFEKVPVCHPVFGHAVTCGVIGVDIPFIFIFGIRNIAFDIESRFHPFLNDFGRNPETPQLEINVFDPQRFRLHSFQCRDILRCQFAGDLQLADHVSAQVCTF